MIDFILKLGFSNLCIALVLGLAAWAVQLHGKRPRLAHLLWLLVLAKLVTPPLVTLPLFAIPGGALALAPEAPSLAEIDVLQLGELAALDAPGAQQGANEGWLANGKLGLALLWLLGSVLVLAWSSIRIYRFQRLLKLASEPAPKALQKLARELAQTLELGPTPAIQITSAQLSPMLWWIGGQVRIYLPSALLAKLSAQELRWILAHELAHVKRKDHFVRWLEWLACVAFWWNPVAWWARRNLRVNEEVCCDALVLSKFHPNPHNYANSLLNVLEFLATPAIRPPAMASQINSGGQLETRIDMIISKHSILNTPRWVSACVLTCAMGLLPLGLAYAQDPDYEAVSERLIRAVNQGELSETQAEAMIGALARARFAERLRNAGDKSTGSEARKPRLEANLKEDRRSDEQIKKAYEYALQGSMDRPDAEDLRASLIDQLAAGKLTKSAAQQVLRDASSLIEYRYAQEHAIEEQSVDESKDAMARGDYERALKMLKSGEGKRAGELKQAQAWKRRLDALRDSVPEPPLELDLVEEPLELILEEPIGEPQAEPRFPSRKLQLEAERKRLESMMQKYIELQEASQLEEAKRDEKALERKYDPFGKPGTRARDAAPRSREHRR